MLFNLLPSKALVAVLSYSTCVGLGIFGWIAFSRPSAEPNELISVPKWGRHELALPSVTQNTQCDDRGHLVAAGSAHAVCDCHALFTGPNCTLDNSAPNFAVAVVYLVYGDGQIENTIKNSISLNRENIKTSFSIEYVIFYDIMVNFSRMSGIRSASKNDTLFLSVTLQTAFNVSCSCAPNGVLDAHCTSNDVLYRGMGYFRAVQLFKFAEMERYRYVLSMDAEAHVIKGDPFLEMEENNALFAFYAWGSINSMSCLGNVRTWSIDLAEKWNIDTFDFVRDFGVDSSRCASNGINLPAICCGLKVSSFSGDIVAFRSSAMRTPPVRLFLNHWAETEMLKWNRSTEQELWPNLAGLLFPRSALHQFSHKIVFQGHMNFRAAALINCSKNHPRLIYSYDEPSFSEYYYSYGMINFTADNTTDITIDNSTFIPLLAPPSPPVLPPAVGI